MKFFGKSILTGLVLVASSNSFASVWCSGKITHMYLEAGGGLYINADWRKQHTLICNINAAWKGVSTDVCKQWVGLATTAKVTQGKVIMHYSSESSCATIPQYSSASRPSYLMLAPE